MLLLLYTHKITFYNNMMTITFRFVCSFFLSLLTFIHTYVHWPVCSCYYCWLWLIFIYKSFSTFYVHTLLYIYTYWHGHETQRKIANYSHMTSGFSVCQLNDMSAVCSVSPSFSSYKFVFSFSIHEFVELFSYICIKTHKPSYIFSGLLTC